MLVEKTDTFNYYNTHKPGVIHRDVSHTPIETVAVAAKKIDENVTKIKPETEALSFYLLNHMAAIVKQCVATHAPLGKYEDALMKYHAYLTEGLPRMYLYLLYITTREARHAKIYGPTQDALLTALDEEKVKRLTDFILYINSSSGTGAFNRLLKSPPSGLTLGEYVTGLEIIFKEGGFGSSFGGKPWANITNCLRKFVYGTYTGEMMLDTSFTLAHNNGPIFNKGKCYESYTSTALRMILDVQRSGQIPQLITHNTNLTGNNSSLRGIVLAQDPILKGGFMREVDWQQVQDLGALGNYSDKIKMQKPPLTPTAKVKGKKVLKKTKVVTPETAKDYLEIYPGKKLKKVTRVEVHA